ncbi:MAG: hypothetical protein PHY93_02795 [Bacteriovorax sp.]|nr:hypothetical protein [Bacteriovorax sp.]
MKYIILILCLISSTAFSNDGHFRIIAEEIVSNFQSGVDQYNKTKALDLPEIKHDKKTNYYFNINEHLIEFSIANYLQGQIMVDKKMKKINPESHPKKTVQFIRYIIDSAYADDESDADPTKIILSTLGSLDKNLQEVSSVCSIKDYLSPFGISTCKKDNTKANMDKLKQAILKRKSSCENISDEQARAPRSDLYTVTADSENDFKLVKELIIKIAESREKKVNTFFKDYMGTTEQKFQSCVDVVTTGTVIDGKGGALRIGARNLNEARLSPEKEEMKLVAVDLCKNIEELRSCLIQVSVTYNSVVNSNRGNTKTTDSLPAINNALGGNTISK